MTPNLYQTASGAADLPQGVAQTDANGALTLPHTSETASKAALVKANGALTLPSTGETALNDGLPKSAQFRAGLASVGAETSLSVHQARQGAAPLALPRPKPAGAAARSLRIHLIIKHSDLGLEPLYQQLAAIGNELERTMHVKRVLHHICIHGEITRISPAQAGGARPHAAGRGRSFLITFRLSPKDVGLEKLYAELSRIEGAAERNQHVRRGLFNAYCFSAQPRSAALPLQPMLPAMALAHSTPPEPDADVLSSSWPNASSTDKLDEAAGIELSVHVHSKRKNAVTAALNFGKPK